MQITYQKKTIMRLINKKLSLLLAPLQVATATAAMMMMMMMPIARVLAQCEGEDLRGLSAGCVSESVCRETAENLGLFAGDERYGFAGDWEPRGCVYYPATGYAFFGVNGTCEQLAESPTDGSLRLDCSAGTAPGLDFDAATECQGTESITLCGTVDDCRTAALAMGLQLGSDDYYFEGAYDVKGCHYFDASNGLYSNQAYWGVGAISCGELAATPIGGSMRLLCGGDAAEQTTVVDNDATNNETTTTLPSAGADGVTSDNNDSVTTAEDSTTVTSAPSLRPTASPTASTVAPSLRTAFAPTFAITTVEAITENVDGEEIDMGPEVVNTNSPTVGGTLSDPTEIVSDENVLEPALEPGQAPVVEDPEEDKGAEEPEQLAGTDEDEVEEVESINNDKEGDNQDEIEEEEANSDKEEQEEEVVAGDVEANNDKENDNNEEDKENEDDKEQDEKNNDKENDVDPDAFPDDDEFPDPNDAANDFEEGEVIFGNDTTAVGRSDPVVAAVENGEVVSGAVSTSLLRSGTAALSSLVLAFVV